MHVILINCLHQHCVILLNRSIVFMSYCIMFLTCWVFSANCIVCRGKQKNICFCSQKAWLFQIAFENIIQKHCAVICQITLHKGYETETQRFSIIWRLPCDFLSLLRFVNVFFKYGFSLVKWEWLWSVTVTSKDATKSSFANRFGS